ncbi:MAG: CoA-acylating methylmalonate-semialdehyde dehydrogenase [Kiritimatiellaeota bacterium]|nr:CoA-acylating methylmalonate-semialdehyde dehydrogenase [Kiritimatiellota bacterium]
MSDVRQLEYFTNGSWRKSGTGKYYAITDPSTGAIIAQAPCCTREEVNAAIAAAKNAFPSWSVLPAMKRVQVLYKFRDAIISHMDELVLLLCRENGKCWDESQGDILKAREVVEFACGIPSLMMGESLMNTSAEHDTVLYREPIGVFAGLVPWNFPAMIPLGWMTSLCIAAGNTLVLKASSATPMTAMRMVELLHAAGLPDGVINLITCSRDEAEIFLKHPDVKGITFVGSTLVGKHIYSTAAAHGKRVQALCEAKNHCLVLEDAPLKRTALGIINATYGCAGERCMALPVVVVQEKVADKLVALLKELAGKLKVGPAYDKTSQLGPLVTKEHRESVLNWIEKGIQEGAELVLDGRQVKVAGYENGFYLGPTIFDRVTPAMSVGNEEIFGPVTCIKRVKDFEEGLALMNASRFANGAVIYTQNGYYSREFARRTHGGLVGINVGIPVPIGIFPFTGHKQSFFGDLHTLGKDGVRFFTESKCVTTRWFNEEELRKEKVDTWDGTI